MERCRLTKHSEKYIMLVSSFDPLRMSCAEHIAHYVYFFNGSSILGAKRGTGEIFE